MKPLKPLDIRLDAEGLPVEPKLLVLKIDFGDHFPYAICRDMGDFRHAIEVIILGEESDDTLLEDWHIPSEITCTWQRMTQSEIDALPPLEDVL